MLEATAVSGSPTLEVAAPAQKAENLAAVAELVVATTEADCGLGSGAPSEEDVLGDKYITNYIRRFTG